MKINLKKLNSLLKSNGKLLLEVPILRELPFADIPTPINPDHVREYKVTELKKKISKLFQIDQIFGVNRGYYTTEENCREACFVVASKN